MVDMNPVVMVDMNPWDNKKLGALMGAMAWFINPGLTSSDIGRRWARAGLSMIWRQQKRIVL